MSMACKELCKKNLKRPHFTCVFACKLKHLEKLDKTHYERAFVNILVIPHSHGNMIVPKEGAIHIFYIDGHRKFRKIKSAILKRLISVCEILAS